MREEGVTADRVTAVDRVGRRDVMSPSSPGITGHPVHFIRDGQGLTKDPVKATSWQGFQTTPRTLFLLRTHKELLTQDLKSP